MRTYRSKLESNQNNVKRNTAKEVQDSLNKPVSKNTVRKWPEERIAAPDVKKNFPSKH